MATKSKQISCVQCHKRKVKCSKTQPCSNCTRRGETCEWIEPPPATEPPQVGLSTVLQPTPNVSRYAQALLHLAASLPPGDFDRARSIMATFQTSHDLSGWLSTTTVWQRHHALKSFVDAQGTSDAQPGLATSLAFAFASLADIAAPPVLQNDEKAPRDLIAMITGAPAIKATQATLCGHRDAYIANAQLCLQLADDHAESDSETIATLYLLHCCRPKTGAFLARAIQLALRSGLNTGRATKDDTVGSEEMIWNGLVFADVIQAHSYGTPRLISDRMLSKRPVPTDAKARYAVQGLLPILDAFEDLNPVPFNAAIQLAQSIEMISLQMPPELRTTIDLSADFSTTTISQLAIFSHTACSQLSLLKVWLLEAIRRQAAGQAQGEITDPALLASITSQAAQKVIFIHLALRRRTDLTPNWTTLAASGVVLFEAIAIFAFTFAANLVDRIQASDYLRQGLALIAPLAEANAGVRAGVEAIKDILKRVHPNCENNQLSNLAVESGQMPAAVVHPRLDAAVLDLLLQAASNDGGDTLISKILGGA